MKRKNKIFKIIHFILVIFLIIFIFLAMYELMNLYSDRVNSKFAESLLNTNDLPRLTATKGGETLISYPKPSTSTSKKILDKYISIHKLNDDVYGWIKIEDTPINYPVMYTPYEPQKYLRLNFNGEKSISGQIFLDYRCTDESENLILYGHNMKNKTMFGSLLKYREEKYFKEHPTINFDTLYEENEYQIVAAFYDEIDLSEKNKFNYYNFIRTENEQDFVSAINTIKNLSIYDTNTSIEYGDRLITLSTCSYHSKNGRFVVIGKKI